MRFLPFENPLSRLFRHAPQREFQVIVRGTPTVPLTQEAVEDATEQALDLLLEKAQGDALGPVAGYDLNTHQIEIEFTIQAPSIEEAHRRAGHIMRLLEGGPFEVQDSTTSRVVPEREPVPA